MTWLDGNGRIWFVNWEATVVESAIEFDMESALKSLDALGAAAKAHLPRSMAVAAGKVFRDEAKARAPVFDGSTALKGGANVKKEPKAGLLRDAIYLAFSDNRSFPSDGHFVYSVAWNSAKAPHGHLLEFGHWRYNVIRGGYPTNERLEKPVWVAAHPFLRPAYDAARQRAIQAGMERGRERTAELLANPALLEQFK
ncbi:HK97-gp10 family putative phage morphogenesis protein [Alcaligenes faecalis]|nr:HK97-gp10 family putative phage morphogenesis protein [Alcaligenes faecalis]